MYYWAGYLFCKRTKRYSKLQKVTFCVDQLALQLQSYFQTAPRRA
jgi:neutral trehalase